MAGGAVGRGGPVVQLLVGEVSVAERGLVTTHHQLMEGPSARTTDQVPLKQRPATPNNAVSRSMF